MSFDEQPDGDIHGECAAEIHRLEQQNAELVAALEKIAAMDYRKSAVNLFGRVAHEIVNVALSKVKQP